jgi:Ni,Fe-hydrogenase I cytochrome b subunit
MSKMRIFCSLVTGFVLYHGAKHLSGLHVDFSEIFSSVYWVGATLLACHFLEEKPTSTAIQEN